MITDQEKIQSVIEKALVDAAGILAVRILCRHMSMWLQVQENVTVAMAMDEAENVVKAAKTTSANADRWIEGGRYNLAGHTDFVRSTVTSSEESEVYYLLGERLYALDQAFKDQFSVESAQHLLSQMVKFAKMFQADLRKT